MSVSSSPRVYLEEISEERHLAGVFAMRSNPEYYQPDSDISEYAGASDLEANRAWVRKRSKAEHADLENFAVMVPASSPLYGIQAFSNTTAAIHATGDDVAGGTAPKIAGFVGVLRLDPPEIGYMLASGYRRGGVMSEALALVLPVYWRRHPDVPELVAFIRPDNKGSIGVARRNGFVQDPARLKPKGFVERSGYVLPVPNECWVLKRPQSLGGE